MRALGWKYQGFETMDSTVFVNALPYGQIIQVKPVKTKRLEIGSRRAAGTDVHFEGY